MAERYGAAFQYVMFNKSGAFNIDSENAAINDAYQQQGIERPRRFNDTWPEALDDQPRYVAAELSQIRAAGSLEDAKFLEINNDEVNPGEGYTGQQAQDDVERAESLSASRDTMQMASNVLYGVSIGVAVGGIIWMAVAEGDGDTTDTAEFSVPVIGVTPTRGGAVTSATWRF